MHGDGQNRYPRINRLDILNEFQTAFSGKSYIQEHQIRSQLLNGFHGLLGIGRFTAYDQIRLPVDHRAQAFPGNGVIIYDQNFFFGHRFSRLQVWFGHGVSFDWFFW